MRLAPRGAYGHAVDLHSLGERCILSFGSSAGPPMLNVLYNNNYQIVQGPGYVAILQEEIHDVRIIPLDGRPHVGPNLRLWMGDSRGHWEGDTLVVETDNLVDQVDQRNTSHSDQATIVERYKLTGQIIAVDGGATAI